MKMVLAAFVLGAGMVGSLQAQAAGCISGAVVGGAAGHVAGHHGLLGAAAGCAIGHHVANKRAAQQNAAQQQYNAPSQDTTTGTYAR